MNIKRLVGVSIAAALVTPGLSQATNGYFSHGYGMKAKGMAGASTAMTVDTFGGANNPATMVFVGDRLDVGIDWFSPKRNASRAGALNGINGGQDSEKNNFFIPEFGYNKLINPNLSLGVTVYGNGGMNTDYPGGTISTPTGRGLCNFFQTGTMGPGNPNYNMLCGNGRLGVDLMQLIIAPTASFKITPQHSIGISPLIGYQRFKAEGLQAFAGLSSAPGNVTNQGYDSSTGFGVRVGWLGKFNDMFSVGAAYASRMRMSSLDKYKGLFAEQGDFDMPENWNVGVAFKPITPLTLALDYQHIAYSKIRSVGNPSTNAAPLGASNGPGFGWDDVDVWKLGAEYRLNNQWTLRAGYSNSNNPIQSRDVTFNILAPGVVQDHYTLGFTYGINPNSELTVSYMHAAKKSVTGNSLFTGLGAGPSGTERIEMYQNSLGVAYGMKF